MTTYLDRMTTAYRAMTEARDAQDGDAFQAAFDELHAAEEERDAVRRAAIDRGLEECAKRGESQGYPDRTLNTLEREAITSYLMRLIEVLEEEGRAELPDLGTEEGRLHFVENYAGYLGESPLFAKLFAAYNIEMDVTDGLAIADGVVGRAVDRAIEDLLPYATAGGGGWYNQNVAPKL